ncbi:DUF4893 domain-containing protein [Pseudomonas sp. PDNC002]|uniref:DUF4893 domain-containing protein n=1 Tax=Pseudomonas sp. PDNC002 TaxID=2811422 RepID=UPI0019653E49|nr:DUF4893 domain-containing protein [Pseudomonas sp. PDNC002]QRY82219.1 DUF4893 domain-containing protein [Pseudomonas sp. PDNC002]
MSKRCSLSAALLAAGLLLSPLAFAEETAPTWPAVINAADQQRLTSLDTQVKQLLDQLQQSEDETTRNEALNLYRIVLEDPEPLTDAALAGNWKCRSVQIESKALYGYPNFKCSLRQTPKGLFLEKTSSSQRISGYLQRLDDKQLVFIGGASVNDDPQVGYSGLEKAAARESDVVGVVRNSYDGFVLLVPEPFGGFNLFRFSR